MERGTATAATAKSSAVAHWHTLLRDEVALLAMPGAHHKTLLVRARSLHQDQVINADDLSDMLELADAALAFAVESLLDIQTDD